jgi:hypothetical protein
MVEALAICYSLTLSISLGYTNVEAKPDSLKVIQLCSGADGIWNGPTVGEIQMQRLMN